MKLPHVTIEYKEEESSALGKMSPAMIIGFGLHWSWVYLAMYSGGDLFHIDSSLYRTAFFIASLIVFAATLLSYGLFLQWFRKLFATAKLRERNRLIAASAMSASVVVTAAASVFPVALVPLGLFAGALSGVGSAVLLMSFGVSFSVCDIAESAVSAAFSFVVAAFAFAAIVAADDVAHPLGVIMCAAIPFVEAACLFSCSRKMVDNLEFSMCTIPVRMIPFGVRVCLPCVVFGVILGFLRGGAFLAGAELVSADGAMTVCLASIAACAFVLAAMLTQRKTSHFMFRTLLPVSALLLALTVTPLAQNSVFLAFAAYAICFMLDASVWVSLADVSQRYRISAFTVFGFGRAALALGTLIAVFTIPIETAIVTSPSGEAASLAIGALVLTILGYALLPTGMEIRKTLKRSSMCPAFVTEDDFVSDGVWGRRLGSDLAEHAASASSEPDGADASGAASSKGTAGEGQPKERGAAFSERQPKNAHGEQPMEADPKHCRGGAPVSQAAMPEERHASDDAEGAGRRKGLHDTEDASSFERMGRFKRKCVAVADTFLLSRKETEVLFLLAKGRNSSAIQEILFISAGTANTHMRNIYRKLNVHSQQELIALVESMDDSE